MAFGRLGRRFAGAGKRKGKDADASRAFPGESPRAEGLAAGDGPLRGEGRVASGGAAPVDAPGPGAEADAASNAGASSQGAAFLPVLLGAGEAAYGMARAFFEGYRVPSVAIAQQVQPICEDSSIVRATEVDGFATGAVFRDALLDLARQSAVSGRALLLVPTENRYARLLSKYADELGEYYRFNIASAPLTDRLAIKDGFYSLCRENGLSFPPYALVSIGGVQGHRSSPASSDFGTGETPREGDDEQAPSAAVSADELAGGFPLMFKPDDPDAFISCEFRGKKNAYELRNRAELDYARSMIAAAGYAGTFVVQRQVAGEFDALRSLTCYCDRSGHVRLVAQADVVLEQAAPWSIGHFGAVIAGADDALASRVATFLGRIGYRGLCNIDVKIDAETGEPQFLDFNVAPCDTSYLATATGRNLARLLVDDLLGDAAEPSKGEPAKVAPDAAAHVETCGNDAPTGASANGAVYATLEPDAAMLSKVPDSTLRQYARRLGIWPRAQRLMQDGRCVNLFLPPYDQGIKRKRAFHTDQHFHRREFADCIGRNHVND